MTNLAMIHPDLRCYKCEGTGKSSSTNDFVVICFGCAECGKTPFPGDPTHTQTCGGEGRLTLTLNVCRPCGGTGIYLSANRAVPMDLLPRSEFSRLIHLGVQMLSVSALKRWKESRMR